MKLVFSAAAMTQSNGEHPQRGRVGLQQVRARIQARSQKARTRVQSITKEDVKGCFMKNAFVIFTVAAVIIGKFTHTNTTVAQNFHRKCFEVSYAFYILLEIFVFLYLRELCQNTSVFISEEFKSALPATKVSKAETWVERCGKNILSLN